MPPPMTSSSGSTLEKKLKLIVEGQVTPLVGMSQMQRAFQSLVDVNEKSLPRAMATADAAAETQARSYERLDQTRLRLDQARTNRAKVLADRETALAKGSADEQIRQFERVEQRQAQMIARLEQQETQYLRRASVSSSNLGTANAAVAGAQAHQRSQYLGAGVKALGTAMMGGGVAGLAIAGYTLGKGMHWQTAGGQLYANTGMSPANIAALQRFSLSQSNQTTADPYAVLQMAKIGMNMGFGRSLTQNTVHAALMSAMPTGADPVTVMQALSTGMNAFPGMKSNPMGAMDVLHAIAQASNMDVGDLASVAAPALAVASQYGPSQYAQALAAIGALTRQGFAPADAVTQVKDLYTQFIRPPTANRQRVLTILKRRGIDISQDFTVQGLDQKGLFGVIADLNRLHLPPNYINALIPNQRGGIGLGSLAGGGFGNFASILQSGQNGMGSTAAGYSYFQHLDSTKLEQLNRQFETMAIQLGTHLLPDLERLEKDVLPVIDAFSKWTEQNPGLARDLTLVSAGLLGAGVATKGLNFALVTTPARLKGIGTALHLIEDTGGAKTALGDAASGMGIVKAAATDLVGSGAAAADTGAIGAMAGGEAGGASLAALGALGPVGWAAAAVVGLGLASVVLYNKWSGFHGFVDGAVADFGRLGTAAHNAATNIGKVKPGAALGVGTSFGDLGGFLGATSIKTMEQMGGPISVLGYAIDAYQQMQGGKGSSSGGSFSSKSSIFSAGTMTYGAPSQNMFGFSPTGFSNNTSANELSVNRAGIYLGNGKWTAPGPAGAHWDFGTANGTAFKLPGNKNDKYKLVAVTDFRNDPNPNIRELGLTETWQTPDGGYFLVGHLSGVNIGNATTNAAAVHGILNPAGMRFTGGQTVGTTGIDPVTGIPHLHVAVSAGSVADFSHWGFVPAVPSSLPQSGGANAPSRIPASMRSAWGTFTGAGSKYGVNPLLLAGVDMQESSGNPSNMGMPASYVGAQAQVYGAAATLRQWFDWTGTPAGRASMKAHGYNPDNIGVRWSVALDIYNNGPNNWWSSAPRPGESPGQYAHGPAYGNAVMGFVQKFQGSTSWTDTKGGTHSGGGSGHPQISLPALTSGKTPLPATADLQSLFAQLTRPYRNKDGTIDFRKMPPDQRLAADQILRILGISNVVTLGNTLNTDEGQGLISTATGSALYAAAYRKTGQARSDPEKWFNDNHRSKAAKKPGAQQWLTWWSGQKSKLQHNLDVIVGSNPAYANADGTVNFGAMPAGTRKYADWLIGQLAQSQYYISQADARASLPPSMQAPVISAALSAEHSAWSNPERWYNGGKTGSSTPSTAGRMTLPYQTGSCPEVGRQNKIHQATSHHTASTAKHSQKTAVHTHTIATQAKHQSKRQDEMVQKLDQLHRDLVELLHEDQHMNAKSRMPGHPVQPGGARLGRVPGH